MQQDALQNDMDDEQIRLLLSACADAAMDSLDEESMDGFDHHFSDKFDKKMNRMLWSERYFGRKIHIGYVVRRAAVFLIIAASLATAGTVSAKVFDFRPWEYIPIYSWFVDDDPTDEDAADWAGKDTTVENQQSQPVAPTPKPTPEPFSVQMGTEARYALSGDGSTDYFPLKVLGYENGYEITLESAPDMEKFYIDGNSIAVSPDAEPGEYTLGYRVKDGNGHEIYQDVTITVEKAVKVTGKLRNSDGTEIRNGYLQFKLTEEDHSYTDHYFFADVDETMGTYTVYLPPNRTYEAYIAEGDKEKRFIVETGSDEMMSHDFDVDAWGVDEDVPPDELQTPNPDGDEDGPSADEDDPYDPGPQKQEGGHERDPDEIENPIREDGSHADPYED